MIDESKWLYRIKRLENYLVTLKKKSGFYSILRFSFFIMILAGIVMAGNMGQSIGGWLALAALIAFIFAVMGHGKIKAKIKDCEHEILVCQQYLDRIHGGWRNFPEKGDEFIKDADTTLLDLDLIGKASLYQLISIARTCFGKQAFYDILCGKLPLYQLAGQQAAVSELSNHEFSIQFQKLLINQKIQNGTDCQATKDRLNSFKQYTSYKYLPFLCLMPLLLLLIGLLAAFDKLPGIVFALAFFIQLFLSIGISLRSGEKIDGYGQLKDQISASMELFKCIEAAEFKSERLKGIQQILNSNGSASSACQRLDIILSLFSLRNNPILYLAFNGLFMIDLQCLYILERWKNKYGDKLEQWLETAGEMEALVSCSILAAVRNTCTPLVHNEELPSIDAQACAHPLIDPDKVVANDFNLKGSNIITGSNMSGKSTFMRCVGINTVLALMGCEVCAKSFSCTPMRVISSMRLHDELSEGISTFYAEILRIKDIMEASKTQNFNLILIDEIFKGTNSADRIVGAKEAIQRLNQPWLITIVTTHDFELCTALPTLTNYHFSETYENNEIHFDYQIKDGQCKTTNAKELMRMAGIID